MRNPSPYHGVKYAPIASYVGEYAQAASGRLSNWRRRFPIFAIVGLFTGLLVLVATFSLLGQQTAAIPNHQLAIRLHPEIHSTRSPTTLTFDWNITTAIKSPDGVEKQVYLVNGKDSSVISHHIMLDAKSVAGQFPGPTIEARSGDRIIIKAYNGLQDEGLSLHWHGLRMKGQNAMDGAVGFTQCPMAAGKQFIYNFTIGQEEHGTFWWHSHSQVQRGDGLFGGLVVHKPRAASASFEPEYLLLVGDWFHRKQTDVLKWFAAFSSLGNEPVPDSIIINGHGRYNCSMAVPARPVICQDIPLNSSLSIFSTKDKVSRLRVVNVGTIAGLSISVQGATLQPVEVEGGYPVEAQNSDAMGILYPGERVDALVRWKEDSHESAWVNIYLDDE